jgi:hypothetical protein
MADWTTVRVAFFILRVLVAPSPSRRSHGNVMGVDQRSREEAAKGGEEEGRESAGRCCRSGSRPTTPHSAQETSRGKC